MNPAPAPFSCIETDRLARLASDAAKHEATARGWQAKFANAETALASASDLFPASLSDSDAQTLASAAARVRDLQTVMAALGDVESIRSRLLHVPAAYRLFAEGFTRKVGALTPFCTKARKALAAKISELVESGLSPALASRDPQAVPFSVAVQSLEATQQQAIELANYCGQSPQKYDRGFDSLLACLTSPLPTA